MEARVSCRSSLEILFSIVLKIFEIFKKLVLSRGVEPTIFAAKKQCPTQLDDESLKLFYHVSGYFLPGRRFSVGLLGIFSYLSLRYSLNMSSTNIFILYPYSL